jgi:Fe2+ or Zn2+ uptake regulation protein
MTPDFAQKLRESGLQVTAQRLAVLRAIAQTPHSTAEGLATQVRAELGAISRQAVYDVLGVLVEKGLIRRIQPAGSAALYEDRVGDDHHHIICQCCGKAVGRGLHCRYSSRIDLRGLVGLPSSCCRNHLLGHMPRVFDEIDFIIK